MDQQQVDRAIGEFCKRYKLNACFEDDGYIFNFREKGSVRIEKVTIADSTHSGCWVDVRGSIWWFSDVNQILAHLYRFTE